MHQIWTKLYLKPAEVRSALDSVQYKLSFDLHKSNKWSYGRIES